MRYAMVCAISSLDPSLEACSFNSSFMWMPRLCAIFPTCCGVAADWDMTCVIWWSFSWVFFNDYKPSYISRNIYILACAFSSASASTLALASASTSASDSEELLVYARITGPLLLFFSCCFLAATIGFFLITYLAAGTCFTTGLGFFLFYRLTFCTCFRDWVELFFGPMLMLPCLVKTRAFLEGCGDTDLAWVFCNFWAMCDFITCFNLDGSSFWMTFLATAFWFSVWVCTRLNEVSAYGSWESCSCYCWLSSWATVPAA